MLHAFTISEWVYFYHDVFQLARLSKRGKIAILQRCLLSVTRVRYQKENSEISVTVLAYLSHLQVFIFDLFHLRDNTWRCSRWRQLYSKFIAVLSLCCPRARATATYAHNMMWFVIQWSPCGWRWSHCENERVVFACAYALYFSLLECHIRLYTPMRTSKNAQMINYSRRACI